jgi:molybdopterin/thiamine biosynthesis adenylyltransferase
VGGARYSRNEALFGAEGQAKIAVTKVAIIGLGGLGSHVAQQLAYLGAADYALVDFDIVTDSSLNRLVGAVDADLAAQTKKIDVAERTIKAVKPTANVVSIDGQIAAEQAKVAISRADIVFGCLDRDIHRLELTEISARHAKPYFDLASDTAGEGDERVYGGRVIFCDGTRCLVCLPEILDQDQIARDRMSPEQREADRRIYGVDRNALAGTGPAVVSLNGVVASLGVTEFVAYVTGLREPAAQLIYRGEHGTVTKSLDQPEPGCYYCSGVWGTGARGPAR